MRTNFYLPDAQEAMAFLVSQLSYIEPQVYEIQYPDIQYTSLIPVDTSAPDWTKSITYFSTDKAGRAGWLHHMAKDIHVADISRSMFEVGVEMADVGYRYSLEEIGQAMQLGIPLNADRANAATRAYEEFVDDGLLRGYDEKNFSGLINYPTITAVLAAVGASGHTTWDQKTPAEILADFNGVITGMWSNSLQIEMANTVLLPIDAMTVLASKFIENTSMTLLDFIGTKNAFTALTGQQLLIRGVRGLETAGTNGSGRMVAYRRDPQVLKAHMPMPHRFLPPWQTGPLVFDVPGIFRFGGLDIRRPGAVRYLDGIGTADTPS